MQSWEMRRAAAREQLDADAEQQEKDEQQRLKARDAKLEVHSLAPAARIHAPCILWSCLACHSRQSQQTAVLFAAGLSPATLAWT